MKRITLLLALQAIAVAVFAQGVETTDIHDDMVRLYRQAGLALPSISQPVTARELISSLELLAGSETAGPWIRDEANRLLMQMGSPETLAVRTTFSFKPELYLNLDRSDFATQVAVEDPAAEMHLGYGRLRGPYLFAKGVSQREWSYNDSLTNIPVPVEGNPAPFENNLVHAGYVLLPVGEADVVIGRQAISVGPGNADSLMVSSRVPFLDAVKVTMGLKNLKMTWVTSTMDNSRANPDTATSGANGNYDFDVNTIFYNIHYFEHRWDFIRAGIGSQVVLARRNNAFHLGDFFPVFSWHNASIRPNNMSLIADMTYAPIPGLEVFVQVGLDDVSAEIFGIDDGPIPTIEAYVAGARYSSPWLSLDASLTGGYTHYLWGNFELPEFLARSIYRIEADGNHPSMPLTSPYGPGAIWLDVDAGVEVFGVEMSMGYLLVGRKPSANLYTTPYESSTAIESEGYDVRHVVALTASYVWQDRIGVSLEPFISIDGGEVGLGMELSGSVARTSVKRISE